MEQAEPSSPKSDRSRRSSNANPNEEAAENPEQVPEGQSQPKGSNETLDAPIEAIAALEPPSEEEKTQEADIIDENERKYLDQLEKLKEMTKQQLLDKKKVPASYYTDSKKERIILQYVENFKRQYSLLYPGRKELLLSPPNEFGVKKFICSTIRETQLQYKELYDFRGCASFISDFIKYEPLEPPHELPKTVVSPTYTLKIQSGNCFDMAILLTSLLRGVGYDAFVVSGYAQISVTTLDQSKTPTSGQTYVQVLPKESKFDLSNNESGSDVGTKYKVKPPRQLKSGFIVKQEARRAQQLLKAEQEEKKALELAASNVKDDEDDELEGLRIHAWVLILPGKREVAEAFFIEPSTGKVCATDDSNYLGLESVFSSQNYWVNMQVCFDGLKGISFDVGDNAKWEFVLLDNTQSGGLLNKNRDSNQAAGNASDDEDDDEKASELVDLTPSWVEKLQITKEQFESRCPAGTKIITYKNAKQEIFADYHRSDGMVSRVIYFTANDPLTINEIHEFFENRKDKLNRRIRLPKSQKVHEFFSPGRIPHGLRENIMVNNQTIEMHFYPSARSDGLVKRIEGNTKVIELFTEREDRLVYRSVTYENENGIRGATVKMAEKFARNPDIPASQEVAKKSYFLKEEKIRMLFHLEEGRIIASVREFRKPSQDQKSHSVELTNNFEVNPFIKPSKKQHLYAQLLDLLRSEQNCLQAIKNSERELLDIVQLRQTEESEIGLTISVYDTLRNETKLPTDEDGKETHKGDEEDTKTVDLDYLSPFLINYENPNALNKEDANAVKDQCLKSLKDRLIEKANIIQGRLDDVTTEYQRRQLAYSRNADSLSVEETDDYVRFCNDALFRIHILEKRLAKHKESAPERYIDIDTKLRSDHRLVAAFQDN